MPLTAGGARIGLLRRDNAAALRRFSDVFAVGSEGVKLVAPGDVATVSRAVDSVVDALVAEGCVPKSRDETFEVAPRWGTPPVFRLDRGAVDGLLWKMVNAGELERPARGRYALPRR